MPNRQTFALLGAGFIGRVHAENLAAQPGIDFARVFDVDASRAAALAEAHGVEAGDDLDEIFSDPAIDAVVVASSTNTHADLLNDCTLEYVMGSKPNKRRGQAITDKPYSLTAKENK